MRGLGIGLRRLEDDGENSRPDISSVLWVRGRMPRWTTRPPQHAGWYAVRFRRDHRNREIVYVDGAREASPDLEWSDRAYQWPLESEGKDDEAAAVHALANQRAWGHDTTPGVEASKIHHFRELAEHDERKGKE